MKIGFISIIGERGQWYVTQNFMRALQDKHELFLLGRPFGVRDGWFQGNVEDYSINATVEYSPTYQLSTDVVKTWIKKNKLDVVFFNEEYDWKLVEIAKEYCKVVTYLDYFTEKTIPLFDIYDKIIVCAKHAYEVFKNKQNVVFVDWGVDTDLFKPTENKNKRTFFHSAGWGGINWRKCSPQILKAFDDISKEHDFTLFFHSQTDLHYYDNESKRIIKENTKISTYFGSVTHPGLYHTGIINVAPSRLEGLGLYLPEGLSCGLPTITTDAPPMNQFVTHKENGLLVKISDSHYRSDPYYFPEYDIDIDSLKEMMILLGSDKDFQQNASKTSRERIVQTNSLKKFKTKVLKIFDIL